MFSVIAAFPWHLRRLFDYVAQDARIALQVAVKSDERRRIEWITRKGSRCSIKLVRGWLSVLDALRLPEPDTSWMDSSIPRGDFTKWIGIK